MSGDVKTIPSLLARNLAETLGFYRALGFCLSGGDPAGGWIEIERQGALLQFYADPPVGTPAAPIMSGTIYFRVTGIDALAEKLAEHVTFEWGPETMAYGSREFGIRDPNGYYLAFSEPG